MAMQGGKIDDITVLVAVVTEEDAPLEPGLEESSWETDAPLTADDAAANATEESNSSVPAETAAAAVASS
jgi:hypothetical protein